MNFAKLQAEANKQLGHNVSPELQAEMNEFQDKLKLLRGDNIYDVCRLFFATKCQNSEQFELLVDIDHGETKEESALKVTRVVEEDILAPVGLRMIRCVMGRVIVSDYGIVGAFVNPQVTATKATYDILGLPVFCEWFRDQFAKHLQASPTRYLTRIRRDAQGNLITVMETIQKPVEEFDFSSFYPYFDFTPAELMRDYQKSKSNVLLIYGVPGTGKSNWMLEMINARGWDDKVYLADRADVLEHPGFPDFVRELPAGSVVLTEDSDVLVEKRTDGNKSMSALLNATAGIVSRDIKIIISTNLKSTDKIDDALMRPGRCFRVMKFQPLNTEQAYAVRDAMELEDFEFKAGRTDITLAEAINSHEMEAGHTKSGFGFNQ